MIRLSDTGERLCTVSHHGYKLTVRFHFNTYPAELIYLIFQPLEVVDRYRDPQPQVVKNYSYLFSLRPNI